MITKKKNIDMIESYLPVIKGVTNGIRPGRNVYEGYQRGWGL